MKWLNKCGECLANVLQDEQHNWSSARCAFWAWTIFAMWYLVRYPDLNNAILAFFTSVFIALMSWAGGPRLAQYLAPQIGAAAKAVGDAVLKRRDPKEGIDPTP